MDRLEAELLKHMPKRVKALAKEIYGSEADAFSHFALQTLYDVDDDVANEACSFGGQSSRGLDAFYQDDDAERVVILLAKYSAKPETARLLSKEITATAALWGWLNAPSTAPSATLRSELAAPAEALAEARAQMPDVEVDLVYAFNGRFSAKSRTAVQDFNRSHRASGVSLQLAGLTELADADFERRSREAEAPSEPLELELRQFFEETPYPKGVKTLVASIDGLQLAEIEQEYRYRIFQSNVRYQLPGKINANIARTLQDPGTRRNFWYYNNGISIVCDEYDLDKKTGTVEIRNLQIVNGCQTTTTLGANVDELRDAKYAAVVLVRIIASADEGLQRDITLYNNKQNAVSDRDLQSNDPVQGRLQAAFAELDPPWFYERKRGGWKAEVGADKKLKTYFGNRQINNEKAAQAAYAFYYDPGEARARKRSMFVMRKDDPSGFYEKLFGNTTTPEWLLVPFLVDQFVAARKREYVRKVKALEGKPIEEMSTQDKVLLRRAWLRFADQAMAGAIGFYLRSRIELSQANLEALLSNDLLDRILPIAYAVALRDLSPFFVQRSEEAAARERTFVPANYLKGNWSIIVDTLQTQNEFRDNIEDDPFADFPLLAVDQWV